LVVAGSAYLTYKINQKLLNPKRIKSCNCPDL
jgi:hypothetical protein